MPSPTEVSVPRDPGLSLTPTQLVALSEEIHSVIAEHESDTSEFVRNLIIQRRLYELKPRRKTWPWPGAANFILPLTRYVVDHYKARIERAFRQSSELWYGEIVGAIEEDAASDWRQIASDAAVVANHVSRDPSHVAFHDAVADVADLVCKDGTAPIFVHYISTVMRRPIRVARGGTVTFIEEPDETRVAWDPIEIQRLVWTIGASGPASSPVFGHWTEMTRGQLNELFIRHKVPQATRDQVLRNNDDPWFHTEERILDEEMGIKRDTTTNVKSLNIYRIHELAIDWTLKDDQPPTTLTVWWHQRSSTIIRIFDPRDFPKSYEIARFTRRGRQFLGAGMSEALRTLNLGANTVVNQTTDAATVANAWGFKFKADSRTAEFLSAAPLVPGAKVPFDEDPSEFDTFQLGTGTTPVSLQLLNFYIQMTELLGKVGPPQLGQVQSASRTPASVGLGILQEGAQLIDSVIDRLKDTFSRCMLRTLLLYANHQPDVFDSALPRDRATALLAAIRDPEFRFPIRVRVLLNVSSATASKERDKQDLVVLTNLLVNVYRQVLEMAVPYTSPQVPPEWKQIAREVYRGLSEVITRLVETFTQFKDPNAALPASILDSLDAILGGGAPGALPTGPLPRVPPAGAATPPEAGGPGPATSPEAAAGIAALGLPPELTGG